MKTLITAAAAALVASVVPIAHSAGTAVVGYSCSFNGVGTVTDGRSVDVEGVLSGGPYVTAEADSSTAYRCTLWAYDENGAPYIAAEQTSEPSRVGTLGPAPVSVRIASMLYHRLQLCTEVRVYHNGQTSYRHHDADGDPTNGVQCSTTKRSDGELVYAYAIPPGEMHGDQCAYVAHNLPVSEGGCLPGGGDVMSVLPTPPARAAAARP